ncbi:MAG: nucleoside deaminase [Flavobacteriales bacterium]|nr:nucleoside deaminase [Flavobacteriales bacterium]
MSLIEFSDEYFMKQAVQEAITGMDAGEVPVGAIVVCDNQVIGRGHNLVETLTDSTAHAEMQAFTSAMEYLGGKYLDECTLYVTLEPCTMCAGASYWSRLGKLVFGASDIKRGYRETAGDMLHPKTVVTRGVMKLECGELLTHFFASKRKGKV